MSDCKEVPTLIELICATDAAVRDQPLESVCNLYCDQRLYEEIEQLEQFWRTNNNLYERVRALTFLYAIHRFILPARGCTSLSGTIPHSGFDHLINRRFHEAIESFLSNDPEARKNDTIVSGLAKAYYKLGLQYLADQVRACVRTVPGNQWMFRVGHSADYPLSIHPSLLADTHGAFPVLLEHTAVRMDLSHSAWSDIFFLGMDRPEFAKVINVSINLSVFGSGQEPKPPVEAYFRIIDEPIIRLVSIDLEAHTEINTLTELFDFGRDYLGLLKAAVIASGLIPPGVEGSPQSLTAFLEKLIGPGYGFELVSSVNNIPKGSRLAVSTNLLACLIAVCMRATGQVSTMTGPLSEADRRLCAARAILGEWLGGSGGGWQDSGGVWPGIKLIEGCKAAKGDAEYGISSGQLLPKHTVFDRTSIPESARIALQNSLILVHGGMAQNVGPILEMVSEKYLLRSAKEWAARAESLEITDAILEALKQGDIRRLGQLTTDHFFGPLKTIIPWASNAFTETLIAQARAEFGDDFWGFWMLGGMSGGGMGFIVAPHRLDEAKQSLKTILVKNKQVYANGLPFAMDPVVYDFRINETGSTAKFLPSGLPSAYYRLRLPILLRVKPAEMNRSQRSDLEAISIRVKDHTNCHQEDMSILYNLLPSVEHKSNDKQSGKRIHDLDQLLQDNGFDAVEHESLRLKILAGQIGLAQNRLPPNTHIKDVPPAVLLRPNENPHWTETGKAALNRGEVGVVTLAAGAGSRWSQGAGIVKALHPFCTFAGKHRNFLEVHLAKSRRAARMAQSPIPHTITSSYLTHEALSTWIEQHCSANKDGELDIYLSRGQSVGLRFVPTVRDLMFAWQEMPQERLDEQAQKVRESVRRALMTWAANQGEASDYRDNLPLQCLHPVGHFYEIPNLLLNGLLNGMLQKHPQLKYLFIHNIDTVGADPSASELGCFIESGKSLAFEVITRRIDDHGGGLAMVNGRPRLVEGLAMPNEADEFKLSYYNTLSSWLRIDDFLKALSLTREDLSDPKKVRSAVRSFASRLPVYLTIKEVKKRWGRGQEDIYPVLQFERLWGDMSAIEEFPCGFLLVPRQRGQQLKEQAQLDAWLRDGSAEHVDKLCAWI
ncbi:MAG: UTP--glucose-1-phosphate uridylyltransferase [Verrucomicrobia bacterium]|nr:UTP--glucose-1-phosphate uridylyltransferase [Verrucomicrobiota bacterium]